MYGYEYEDDVLGTLRLLKYIHDTRPEVFRESMKAFYTITADDTYDIVVNCMWDLFDDIMYDWDDEFEMEIIEFSDTAFSRYLEVSRELCALRGRNSNVLYQRKLQDITEFYLCAPSYSLWRIEQTITASSYLTRVWLSPDCYEPVLFANNLLDMLLHVRKETALMEEEVKKLKEAEGAGKALVFPGKTREEAA